LQLAVFSEAAEFNEFQLPDLPTYDPPLKLRYKPSELSATGLSKLKIFKKLFSQAVVDIIVDATNSYAENARGIAEEFSCARLWKPVNSTGTWRYITCLLYMGEHTEKKHEERSSHYLNESLALERFQQIHRYFTLRDRSIHLRRDNKSFISPVKPCQEYVIV
jgi:Transposase IS4